MACDVTHLARGPSDFDRSVAVAELDDARKEKSRLLLKGTKKEWAERVTRLEEANAGSPDGGVINLARSVDDGAREVLAPSSRSPTVKGPLRSGYAGP